MSYYNNMSYVKKGYNPWTRGMKGKMPKNWVVWNKGKSYSEETKLKMSKIAKKSGSGKWMKGRKHSEERKEKILLGLSKFYQSKQPTSIEKTLYDYLLLKGILFERQYVINGKFIVDAYIPSLNLVIEADGKYWHNKVEGKDKAENAYLKKCGFNLTRLTEKEINSGEFKERLVL